MTAPSQPRSTSEVHQEVVTLKEYCERLICAAREASVKELAGHERESNARFEAAREALAIANVEMAKNLEHLNKLRDNCVSIGVYESGHRELATRVEAGHKEVDAKLQSLELTRAQLDGKASAESVAQARFWVGVSVCISGLSIIVGVTALLHDLWVK